MKRLVLFTLTMVAALVVCSCSSSNVKDKDQRMKDQVATMIRQDNAIDSLTNQLNQKAVEANKCARDLAVLSNDLLAAQGKNQALSSQLKKAKTQVTVLTSALANMSAAHDSVETYASELANAKTNLINELAQCGEEKKAIQDDHNGHVQEIGLIVPWYYKWRHDAHRSFIKVMVGAGKAEEPGYPEPDVHP